MWQIGVWEHDEQLAETVTAIAAGAPALVRAINHPALLAGNQLDLLIVSPGATGWAGASALSCRMALLPGGRPPLTRLLPAGIVVSYGCSPRDTLTLSSLDEGRACVAVQREFVSLDGHAIERQELVLPYNGIAPELFLAQTGTALFLGRLPAVSF